MAVGSIYRISAKSQEQRGGGNANVVELEFANDADALQFAQNWQLVCAGTVVGVDKLVQSNYAMPYPVGVDAMVRFATFDNVAHWMNSRVPSAKLPFAEETRSAALIAAGWQIWNQQFNLFYPTAVINAVVFEPNASV